MNILAPIAAAVTALMSVAFASEPAVDFSGVKDPVAGGPTQVLVLGTTHLNQIPTDMFEPDHLSKVLKKLEAFAPDVVAVEAVGGLTCDALFRHESLYPEVGETYCYDPQPALDGLQMTAPEAIAAYWREIGSLDGKISNEQRRRLAALAYGAREQWTAALHWRALPKRQRKADAFVTDALVEQLNSLLASRNESNLIGVELASRLRHNRVAAMDDHSADFILNRADDVLWETMQKIWAQDDPQTDAVLEQAQQYLGSADSVLEGYRYINTAAYQKALIANDFALAAATTDNANISRHYLAWWQARGLRMAANVIEASGNKPGAKVLVIVGASHKAYFDAYLDQMHDIEVVSVADVLAD
ncbi:MAG: DUF5694 domain-containing protein [Pseudomonadota bacterium]